MWIGVLGATGRMGRVTCRAVLGAADLELTAAVAGQGSAGQELREFVPEAPAGLRVRTTPQDLLDAKVEAVVDFSRPEATLAAARLLLPAGVHLVSGTTGLAAAIDELRELAGVRGNGNAVWAPNFALGAVLAQRFAAIAARYYQAVEVIELHYAGKADAPSGTAIRTAQVIAAAREAEGGGPLGSAPAPTSAPGRELVTGARGGEVDGVRVHSVRLPGLVAHQEVIFGGQGEVLTLRHDSLDLSSFMPAVLLSVRSVPTCPGLTVGLEPLLDL